MLRITHRATVYVRRYATLLRQRRPFFTIKQPAVLVSVVPQTRMFAAAAACLRYIMTKLAMCFHVFLCAFVLFMKLPFAEAIECFNFRVAEKEPHPTTMPVAKCKPGVFHCVKTIVIYEYNSGGSEGTTQERTTARCAFSEDECLDIGCVQRPPSDIMGIKKTNIQCCSREDLSNSSSQLSAAALLPVVAIILLSLLFTS
uniref:Uncharacterized protein n=1 Tax=Plectus sambesii TaxID=2011161 RepID=A0A914XPP4_9BILA